jgi:shikimate kinase
MLKDVLKGANLYLIGMMGVGKTTIGRILARQLDYEFFDTDEFIEKATGQTVSTIFAESGEAIFRQLETSTLSQICARTQKVIATGGGIVLKPENWSYLKHGVIIWIDVPVDQLQRRLRNDSTRPLLQHENLTDRLTKLLSDRATLYAQADLRVTVNAGESASQVASRLVDAIALKCEEKRQADEMTQRLNAERPFQLQDSGD